MPTYDFRDKEDKGSKKKQIGKLYAFSPLNSSEKFPPEVFSRFVLSLRFRNVTGRKECTLYHFDFHFDFYFVCFFPNSYSGTIIIYNNQEETLVDFTVLLTTVVSRMLRQA